VLGLDKARPRVSSLLAPSPPRDRLPPGGWLGREAVTAVAHQEKEEGVRRREKGRAGDHLSARGGNGSAGRTIEGAEPHERRCPYAFFRGREERERAVMSGEPCVWVPPSIESRANGLR
jgi:hypothetical protein